MAKCVYSRLDPPIMFGVLVTDTLTSSPLDYIASRMNVDTDGKLWMGDLESYMDEAFLTSVFAQFGYHVQSIRWIKNYQTGLAARYCFVEFNDDNVAHQALESLNGQTIPGTSGAKRFKLNWANRKAESGQIDYNVFVADISRDVTSQQLLEFFQQHYKSIRYAKIVEDEDGSSKGYGFVRFMDEYERDICLSEMDGAMGLGRKPLTIKPALTPKTRAPLMPTPDVSDNSNSVQQQQWSKSTVPFISQPQQIIPHSLVPYMQQLGSYVEDLVDPNPPNQNDNDAALYVQTELYLTLEACRWQTPPDVRML